MNNYRCDLVLDVPKGTAYLFSNDAYEDYVFIDGNKAYHLSDYNFFVFVEDALKRCEWVWYLNEDLWEVLKEDGSVEEYAEKVKEGVGLV